MEIFTSKVKFLIAAIFVAMCLWANGLQAQEERNMSGNTGPFHMYFPFVGNAYHDASKASVSSIVVMDEGNVNGPSHLISMDHATQQGSFAILPFAINTLAMTDRLAVMASEPIAPNAYQLRSWDGQSTVPMRQAMLTFPGTNLTWNLKAAGTARRGGEVALFGHDSLARQTGLGDFGWWIVDDSLNYLYKRSFCCGASSVDVNHGSFLASGSLAFVGNARFSGTGQRYSIIALTDSLTMQPTRVVRLRLASGANLSLTQVRECSSGILFADEFSHILVMLDHGLSQVLWCRKLGQNNLLGIPVEGEHGILTGAMTIPHVVPWPSFPFFMIQPEWGHFGIDMYSGELAYAKYVSMFYGGPAPDGLKVMQPFRLVDGKLREIVYHTDNYHSEWNLVQVDSTGFLGCNFGPTPMTLLTESVILDTLSGWTTDDIGVGSLGAVTASLVSPVYPKPLDLVCSCHPQVTLSDTLISQFTFQFSAMSYGNAQNYNWDFGDGTQATGVNPVHAFPGPGTYVVTACKDYGCGPDCVTMTVVVTTACPLPVSAFTKTTSLLTVSFNSSASIGTGYLWQFGDGTTSTLANPSHTYAAAGTYNACLIRTNNCGTDTFCQTLTLTCPLPVAVLGFVPSMLHVSFIGGASTGTSFLWQFGDGTTSTLTSPQHNYPASGTYNACLINSNACGADTVCQAVTVNCPSTAPSFTYFNTLLNVNFSATATGASSYQWNFGDGTTGNLSSASHVYPASGTYNVCLYTTNACRTDTVCQLVTVVCTQPFATFTYTTSSLHVSLNNTGSFGSNTRWEFGDGTSSFFGGHTYAAAGTYNVCLIMSNICGADTFCQPVTVLCTGPTPIFNSFPNQLSVSFNNQSGGNSFLWQFGDGGTSTSYSPIYTYASFGTYNVCMTTTNSCGSSTICHPVTVSCSNLPTAAFTQTTNLLTATFNSAGSTGTSYAWDFGDGQTSALVNPSHTYATAGTYNACLTMTNACGATTVCQTVTITCPLPVATFSPITNLLTALFNSTGSTGISYAWDFGDGQTSTLANVTHTYATAGTYNVCLTMTNSCGSTTVCHAVTVACPLPTANFSQTTNVLTANFNSAGSTGTTYAWDFGDGQTSTLANPSHAYATAGTYNVCLITTNTCGSDTACASVTVTCPLPTATFAQTTNVLTANFNSAGSTGTTYAWDFGDGQTSTVANPSHTYATPGTYNACLTMTNSCGSTTVCNSVTVTCPLPTAAFTQTTNLLTANFNSSGSSGTMHWDFGDGQTSTASNPSHAYASPGTYNVCLITTNTCGSDTTCHAVTVTCPLPTAAFTQTTNLLTANFNSSGSSGTMHWDFGDGQTSSLANPTHSYASPGTYSVCLTATNSCGSDTICVPVIVTCPAPNVGFSFSANGLSYQFTNQSLGNGVLHSLWHFGDGGTSIQTSPTHTYLTAGAYMVCLEVADTCFTDSTCTQVMAVGVHEQTQIGVELYPQPSDAVLYFRVLGNAEVLDEAAVYSAEGKLVWSWRANAGAQTVWQVPTESWSAGVYLLHLRIGESRLTHRFSVLH